MFYSGSSYYVPKFNTEARSYLYYIKIIYSKLSFFIMLILSIVLLTNYNKNSKFNENITNFVNIYSRPIVYSLDFMDKATTSVLSVFKDIIFLYKDNKILLEQNRILKDKVTQIYNLEYENENLKKITNFVKINNIHTYKTLKYNAITKNKFTNKIRLNIGKNDNINDMDLVVDKNGNLIGKIVKSTDNSSEIMLLTDRDSKVEAITYKNRIKLILNGSNSDFLNILYVNDSENKLINGDSVYFINSNNSLEKELFIGKITKVNDEFKVKIDNSFNYIDYITIIGVQ